MLPSDFNYYRSLTIDHTKVGSDLSNFPVMVKLTSDNFDFSQLLTSDGVDIRFFDGNDDNANALYYEVEEMDIANSEAIIWVKVPTASSTADTVFYMYWGNSSATDGSSPHDVWDSDYKAIWHLNGDPSGASPQELDSTTNGNDGTCDDSMTSDDLVAGECGKALHFDGSNDRVTDGSIDFAMNSFTMTAWFKTTDSGDRKIVSDDTDHPLQIYNSHLRICVGGCTEGTTAINDDNWHFAVVVGDNDSIRAYLDGNSSAEISKSASSDTMSGTWKIGEGGGHYFLGLIDEVRFSSIPRSLDWIIASYYSESDTLLVYGDVTGNYKILGQVTLNGVGVSGAIVRVINQANGIYIGDTTTDSNGYYSINCGGSYYHVVVEYTDGNGNKYNAASLWDIQGVKP